MNREENSSIKGSTQKDVLDYLTSIPSGITFIHGKAGSGKTHLIKELVSKVNGCQVLAPTNLAASLYKGARTIHSFFHGALDNLDEGYQNPHNLEGKVLRPFGNQLMTLKMIIIDELSMVRSDLFEMMNQICQRALNNNRPFGGIPLVLVGDMFQLPPIVSDDEVYKYLKKEYGGIYFFNSHIIQKELPNIKYFELTKSYRQANDPAFVNLLDTFRKPMTANQKVEIMDKINNRVTTELPSDAIYVASSNEEVRQINKLKLDELPGQITTIDAEYTIQKKDRNGYITIKHCQLPSNEDICEIVVPSAYDSQLRFKRGARVVLCKSSKYWGYVNGDFGTIEDFNGSYFTIKLENDKGIIECPNPNDRYKANQMNEYRYEMEYNPIKHRLERKTPFIQKTTQFPLKLAYAFTIHKAQGQTYEKVIIDLNSHIFAPGQLYVALSRAKSLQGLYLTKPVTYSDIISDESIFTFLNRVGNTNIQQPIKVLHSVTNTTCDGFTSFIQDKETNTSSKEYMLYVLNSFKSLVNCREYEKACWELQKIIDIIISTYQTEEAPKLLTYKGNSVYTENACQDMMKAIYEIYKIVVNSPLKQYQSDNRTIALDLK